MQTHPDHDAPRSGVLRKISGLYEADPLTELRERARDMMFKGGSSLTVGKPGEEPLGEMATNLGVFVTRLPPDPQCLRVSIGRAPEIPNSGYLVFRGEPEDVADLLERAAAALRVYRNGGRKRER